MKLLLSCQIFLILFITGQANCAENKNEKLPTNYVEVLKFSLKHSSQLREIEQNYEQAQLEVKNALAKMFPSFDLSFKLGPSDQSPRRKKGEWDSEFNLGLSEKFYDNHQSINQWKIAQAHAGKIKVQLQEIQNRICRNVSDLYLKWSLKQKSLEIQQTQYQLLSKQHQLLEMDYYQGLKSRRDLLRIKTQLRRAESDINNSENEINSLTQDLYALIGLDANDSRNWKLNIFDVPENKIRQLKELKNLDYDLDQHFVARQNEQERAANQIEINLAQRKYWPVLSLTSGINYDSDSFIDSGKTFWENDRLSWNALISVKLNLWDWGIRRRDIAISKIKYNSANARMNQNLLNTKSEIEKVILNIARLQKNLDISLQLLDLEQTNLKTIEAEYRVGKSSYLDLVTALQNFADAKLRRYSSLFDLQMEYFRFLYHRGELYDHLFSE